MVEPVAMLLNGRGHPVRYVRDIGLAQETDAVIADYALAEDLVIVTFDLDFRRSVVRKGARCLHIRHPERTARRRLADHFDPVIAMFWAGAQFVMLPSEGPPRRMA